MYLCLFIGTFTYLVYLPAYVSKYEGVMGEIIEKTTDLSTTCGYVLMAHANEDSLVEDFEQLILLQNEIYEFLPSSDST